jgi:phospholipid transport system substrate-binding protein
MGRTLAAWLMVAGAMASPVAGPRKTVERAVVSLVGVLQQSDADGRAQADRRAEIRRIARGLFDFDEFARRTLSRHWAGRTDSERAEFVGLFTNLLERSYLNRLEAFAGERIVYTAEVIDGPYATVSSKLLAPRRSAIRLDYRMRWRDGRWQAYDVLIDGVSFVATYRAQFDRLIQAESYSALVERLRKRTLDTAGVERK